MNSKFYIKVASVFALILGVSLTAGLVASLSACGEKKLDGLSQIEVVQSGDGEPQINIPDDFSAEVKFADDNQTALNQNKVVREGTGELVSDEQNVELQYITYSMPGKILESSSWQADGSTNWFPMFANASDPNDIYNILKGAKVGALILQVIPGMKDDNSGALDEQKAIDPPKTDKPNASISSDSEENTDSPQDSPQDYKDEYDLTGKIYTIQVLRIKSIEKILPKADGEEVPASQLDPNLPKVTLKANGEPQISISPDFKPSGKLVSQLLKKGAGDVITPDDLVDLKYTGWLTNGKSFESSWDEAKPTNVSFDSLIDGWKEALKDAKIGSQYIIIIPPELAYGKDGADGVPPNSTVIFVVDILGKLAQISSLAKQFGNEMRGSNL